MKNQAKNEQMKSKKVRVSPLAKTWILDLDGTIVVHNGPYIYGEDRFLPGAREFLDRIPPQDMIIFLTARSDYEKPHTLKFLRENHVRYDHIIFNAGHGERILINDDKPDGLVSAMAFHTTRDVFCDVEFITDDSMGTMYD